MLQKRVIPCMLLKGQGLVKTVRFKDPRYIGDPINAIKIFNDKEVDELIFLDITASIENRSPNFELIKDIASECFMPFAYGGGISSIEDAQKLFAIGVEKLVINSSAVERPELISELSSSYGSQSIIISIDIKKNFWGSYEIYTHSGTRLVKTSLQDYIKKMEDLGIGEIFLNSIDKDGTLSGYDLNLIKQVSSITTVPVIICGGAKNPDDFKLAIENGASAVAAGSMFVFYGKHKAVLITYPTNKN